MERGLVERESGLPFRGVTAAAIKGRGPLKLVQNGARNLRGIMEARAIIQHEQPGAILGTGGYVCFPIFAAARMLGVPTMIYLPDVKPGLAVNVLARIATRVACSFEPSLRYLPRGKTIVTGYPVREELFNLDKNSCRAVFGITDDRPALLVYGGSRGARSINKAIEALLGDLLPLAHIIHVCGREGDEGWLQAAAERQPAELRRRYHLFPYLFNTQSPDGPSITDAFGAADLAVARAGASTLAELPAARLPAVLVPLVIVDQDRNADYLVDRGAAVSVPDDKMLGNGSATAGQLFREVQRLLLDKEARERMAQRSAALARPNAANALANELLRLAGVEAGVV